MTHRISLLKGKTAIITGAGGGIGRGLALEMASAGANVVIAARRGATGDETAAMVVAEGGSALSVQTDVTDFNQVKKMVEAAISHFGAVDTVIHNATHGLSGVPAQLESIGDEAWDQQVAVDLLGAHHLARASFPSLKAAGNGRVLLFCSTFGHHGAAMNPTYAAIKGALRGFTKALAREWGQYGITVNAIAPSALTEPAEAFFAQAPEIKAAYLRNFPLGRIGRVREDIGRAVVAICSDDFSYITGQVIQVDGGLYTANS